MEVYKVRWARILPGAFLLAALLVANGMFMNVPKDACAQSIGTGCATGENLSTTDSRLEFTATNYDLANVQLSGGKIVLDTGLAALDPNNIVIPYDQEVTTVFLLEGAGYRSSLGWFLKDEAETKLGGPITGTLAFSSLVSAGVTINYLFRSVEDDQEAGGCCNGGDGVLDSIYDANDRLQWSGLTKALTEAQLTTLGFMPNNDGVVDTRDMRKSLGTLAGGTEIVFFLHADDDISNKTFYSKNNWSPDVWNASGSAKDNANLVFDLSIASPEQGGPATVYDTSTTPDTATQGFVPTAARDRLGNPDNKSGYPVNGYFDVQLNGTRSKVVTQYQKYNHYVVAAPPDDPFKWIIGMEDLLGGGDADFNDLVFMIERSTGGVAELNSSNAISPSDPNAYITTVTFGAHDIMPSTSCNASAGITRIDYFISVDNGANWVEITSWDTIKTPDSAGSDVAGWTFGNPEETYRQVTLNFTELGLTGRQLLWKAQMSSGNDACQPGITDIDLSYQAALNTEFSRSSPTTLGNVIYSASFETPDSGWSERVLRGHFRSTQLYNPETPSAWAIVENWDAGEVLGGQDATGGRAPSSRTVLFPSITTYTVSNENTGLTGDGTATTFSGTLTTGTPIIYSTVTIGNGGEWFNDKGTDRLESNLGSTGTINRFTGKFQLTFASPPATGAIIEASYQYYNASSAMTDFNSSNVDASILGMDNSSYVDATGTHYYNDFDGDDQYENPVGSDSSYLANWTLGYVDGSGTEKEWVLGAIDHSAPAIAGSPGLTGWYFGTDVDKDERETYDMFRCENRDRPTVAFVGARDGQLHAFYAGEFRPYYVNPATYTTGTCTAADMKSFSNATNELKTSNMPYYPPSASDGTSRQILINRGYYDWRERSNGTGSLSSDSDNAANYGNGYEMYSIIPVNLLSRLKNNLLETGDGAYVDASPALAHVRFANNSWRTVMLSAEGNGGDTVFAIDVTNPNSPLFLWEFSDPDLYRSRSNPSVGAIGRILTTTGVRWVALFVSGINNDITLDPSIYMLDVETGELIQRIYLDSAGAAGLGGTPSGVPALVDSDGNGYVDRFYIGTDKGIMYKGTLPDDPDASSGSVSVCTLFDTASGSGGRQPIYSSPAVLVRNTLSGSGETEYKIDVFFGTSDSPYQSDYAGGTYYFYAVRDTDSKGSCSTGSMQWEQALAAGERVFASAFASAGRIYFGTTTAETDDPCSLSVTGSASVTGNLYIFDADGGPAIDTIAISGGVTTSPIVNDEHLYVKSGDGDLQGRGGSTFQNEIKKGGIGEATVGSWFEIVK